MLFKKQLFDLEVNGQCPTKVITVRDTPPYDHAPTYQVSLTYPERRKCYGPEKKIMFKKTIIWPSGQRSRSHEGYYGMRYTALWSCTHIPNKYYLKNNYLTLRSKVKIITVHDTPPYGHAPTYQISLTYLERQKCYDPDKKILFKKQLFDLEVKVPRRSLRYAPHRLMIMHPHTKYNWPISKDKNVMARTRKYYSKNNYLTLRSTVKVSRRSLWYATHRLMVMHPHTKYNWPIWKDKKVMVRTSFTEKKQKRKKKSD
jgi:hypothetical protein